MNWFKKWIRSQYVRIYSFENTRGKWQWGLKANNGEPLDNCSEEYSSYQACEKTVDTLVGKTIRRD